LTPGGVPIDPSEKQIIIMANDNRISAQVTDAVKTQILAKLAEIKALLPFLINLTPAERRSIPHLGTERGAMDEAFWAEMAAHPELVPSFINMSNLALDRALRSVLAEIAARTAELHEGVTDTGQAAGSDIFMGYMAFYANVQQAAKRGVAGTDATLANLARFIPRGRRAPAPPPPNP
jgi:hypothetical protein